MALLNTVLLLKSQVSLEGNDPYEVQLKSKGYKVQQIKTLDFIYKNIDTLEQSLKNVDEYSGLIFSSPRCVTATYMASKEQKLNLWTSKYNFAVGEATHQDAMEKLGVECKGKECGNALNLSKFIIEEKSKYHKPFLFPHGNLKTDTLKTELSKCGLSMEGVLVYDTIPNPNIKKELSNITNNFSSIAEYIVFFSPSGLQSSIDYIRKVPVDLSLIKFVAIGPVTEEAMKQQNLSVYAVAKSPTPQDVLNAILGV